MMGLVDDDEIEAAADEARCMFAATRQRKRSDQILVIPEPARVTAQQCVLGRRARNIELGLKFFPPLPDERRRDEHEHAVDDASQQILLEYHPGLDGLAEPDLVGEQHPTAKLLEHLAHGLHLVPERFDAAQMRQAEQFIETLSETEVGETLAQPVPTAVTVRRLLHGGQQRREIEVGAKRDRYVDDRQAGRCDRRDRRLDSWGGCALVPRLAGLDPDRRSSMGVRHSAPTGGSLVAPEKTCRASNPLASPFASNTDRADARLFPSSSTRARKRW